MGKKYPPFDLDQSAARRILDATSVRRFDSELVLEGGSIDSNGQGIIITTSMCQQRRNPARSLDSIREELCSLLNLDRLVFLDSIEIEGDDTDGHVDQVARFVSEKQIVVSQRQLDYVKPCLEELCSGAMAVELIPIPDPDQVRMFEELLPTSYTNFYIANELVIVPGFGVPQDSVAVGLLKDVFPDRFVISLPCRELAVGLGAFHCLTQQQPS